MTTFQKASRKRSKLRMALVGPSGSGKTYSALKIARGLVGPEGRIAVIDTERGSASLYEDVTDFDVMELVSFSVENYIDAIKQAVSAQYSVLIIDSLSHAWSGKDGLLEFVDNEKRRNKNDFGAWRNATPLHNRLVDEILQSPIHVIVTMRSKVEYVIETVNGKSVPRKIGMQPVQRDGLEYEFTLVGDMDHDHALTITKSRCSALQDKVFIKPNGEVSATLRSWLDSGSEPVAVQANAPATPTPVAAPKPAAAPAPSPLTPLWERVKAIIEKHGATKTDLSQWFQMNGIAPATVTYSELEAALNKLESEYANFEAVTSGASAHETEMPEPSVLF